MRYIWDPRKAAVNSRKHGVTFEEATTAVSDDFAVTGADPDHSVGEQRWITFGISRGRGYHPPHQCTAGNAV
jgi:uncharacterized protein